MRYAGWEKNSDGKLELVESVLGAVVVVGATLKVSPAPSQSFEVMIGVWI